ncbi:MarR family winged helix-turn-helix transcriptional regulator [Paenibacillus sp. J2TS4]|uniref:MarR family winged helix-turn-helix transcriptional regulator n=1 Tax=Paenibacillus sp. J2TS4 TaxID=2807194 RepID=UPI001B2EFEDB|nr:MarR family winged helix-turn-helix transcriptional regulator [Paenibacillus sp. J2TS4]GIP32235.1 MarR family transcriptional regulator [Paenibacillus sp. J2TS4]
MDSYLSVVDRINQAFEQFKSIVWRKTTEIEQLNSFQLTPQQELIMYYIIRNEPVTANQIAATFQISKSAVSQVLPKLEKEEMIVRRINPDNRRESFVYLGEQGKAYAALLHQIDELLVRQYYSKVPLEDLQQVLEVLHQLIAAAQEDLGEGPNRDQGTGNPPN